MARRRSIAAPIAWTVGLALVYAALSRAVTVVTAFGGSSGTTFWPAAGVTVAVLLARSRREWPWLLSGVWLAEFSLNHWVSHLAFDVSAGWAFANVIEPLVAASLLRAGGRAAPLLTDRLGLARYLGFAVLLGPAVGALVGTGSASALGFYDLWPALPRWFVGDAIGALVLGPVALAILIPRRRDVRAPRPHVVAGLFVLAAMVSVVLAPWNVPWDPALPYLILPLPALFAFTAGPFAAAAAVAIVAVGVNAMTAAGYGPYAIPDEIAGLIEAQAFVAMTAVSTLIVSQLTSALTTRAEIDLIKTTYLRTVAHDIRSPLAVIQGMALTIEQNHDVLTPNERSTLLTRIAASAGSLDRMVNEILDEQRLEIARPQRKATDVSGLIAEAVDRMSSHDHPIEQIGDPLVAHVDPLELGRIVENLLSNAIKHTPAGTPVWIGASRDGRDLHLFVEDAGPGIPDRQKRVLFEPLLPRGRDDVRSGIGLSLVAQFAKRQGGEVWVEDREGGGTVLRVQLEAS